MKKYQYKCTLRSDIIITSMSATEGCKESLDYIPGSKFMGIVAGKLYDEDNQEKTLDIFHNGKVSFGDATLMINDEAFEKVPFSWFHQKGKGLSDKIFLHHLLTENEKEEAIQLKQARNGYFSYNKKCFTTIDQDFSLKSAHDRDSRKSKDGQMFGYFSLKSGSSWTFCLNDTTNLYAEDIKKVLVGKHRIGRSRSAEYGLVEISFMGESPVPNKIQFDKEVILYAKSNLCFYNNLFGQTTSLPSAKDLVGTNDAVILWDKCQIRSRNYKTWNRHRSNKDADKIIIERGSVFVVQLGCAISSDFFENGIGSHKNEGFGSILVNPPFLSSTDITLEKIKLINDKVYALEKGVNDDEILDCLFNRKKRNDFDYFIDQKVNQFVKEYKTTFDGISKSQWGTLRNYGKNMPDKKSFETIVFHEKIGFLFKGQSENDWRTKNRRGILKQQLDTLENSSEYLSFIVKFSNLMAKNN
jgi:hypothetical protein